MEGYKLEITKTEFLAMLSNYFTLKLNKPVQVKEEHTIRHGYRDEGNVEVTIYYEEKIEILGRTATKTTTLSKERIKEILNELINNEDYTISQFSYDTDVYSAGDQRDPYDEAVFNGVTIYAEEKQKQLRK